MKKLILGLLVSSLAVYAEMHPVQALVEAARTNSPVLTTLLAQGFPNFKDYLFAAETPKEPAVSVDGQAALPMTRIRGSNLWYRLVKMRIGVTHAYHFQAEGKELYARRDIAGHNPDSFPQPGVPRGTLWEKKTIVSKIYPGSSADYWVYVSPGVDPSQPAPLMVWQDGQTIARGDLSGMRLFTVTENLVHQKLIPPMIHVMISPGIGDRMRSIQYDTVSDIGGESSGAICSLTAAWFFPDQFSRVLSSIGIRRAPVATRGSLGRREHLPLQDPPRTQEKYSNLDERWL